MLNKAYNRPQSWPSWSDMIAPAWRQWLEAWSTQIANGVAAEWEAAMRLGRRQRREDLDVDLSLEQWTTMMEQICLDGSEGPKYVTKGAADGFGSARVFKVAST